MLNIKETEDMPETIFFNTNVIVTFAPASWGTGHYKRPCIQWYDNTDHYNDFKGFTRNVRDIKEAVAFVKHLGTVEELKDDLTMGDITEVMCKFNLKPHTYCGMD